MLFCARQTIFVGSLCGCHGVLLKTLFIVPGVSMIFEALEHLSSVFIDADGIVGWLANQFFCICHTETES